MDLVETQELSVQTRYWQVISSIHNSMTQISSSVQFQPWIPSQSDCEIITYITLIEINSIDSKIKLFWEFKLLSHVLIIKISLLDQQAISHQIKNRCQKNQYRQKVIYYFNHINNLSFAENQGEFYLHGETKVIFQYREDNWYALKNPYKLKLHLNKKLKKISQMFKKNIQAFLIKFKFIPSLQIQTEEQEKLQHLNKIKYFFQQNKKNPCYPPELYQNMLYCRKNYTQTDFKSAKQFDKRPLFLYEGKSPISLNKNHNQNIRKHSIKQPNSSQMIIQSTTSTQNQDLRYKFKNKCLSYNNFSQYNELLYPLVIAMQILQVKNQTLLKSTGGFGQITRGLYSCKYGKTIYDDINKELQGEIYYSEQIFNRFLCKKSSLQKNCQAFQNQKEALMKLRNKKSPHIAQYYCNISKGKPFDDGNIYMDVYASNIEDIPIKLKHKFKILIEIMKGLTFLNQNGIIHRDLKPQNIVVDRQMNSKIIDFGSCSNVYQKEHLFKPFDSKLRSTKDFFVPYQVYTQSFGKKGQRLTKVQFYQHFFFDIYSFGKIIQKLFNLIDYQFVEEDFLMSQMYYLYEKCCEINPADRLSHEEIQFFLENLIKLEKGFINS